MNRTRLARAGRAIALAAAVFATSALAAPDMNKVIREVFPAAETGFDPAAVHDLYSGTIVQGIFETLYSYDYLARPAKVVPLTADGMPQITDSGRTWTVKLKKGIRFADDPAFGGKARELTAEDYVYSLKRLIDPKLRSPWAFLVEGKFVGLDELAAKAKASGSFDYDAKIPGIEALDRHTIRFRLKATDYNLPYILAHEPTAAVAREVIAKYAEVDGRAQANPVGTGPYRLVRWVRSSKIFLEANPHFRGFTWDFVSDDPADAPLIREMKGKSMPAVGRVEISIIEEDQARLLAFQNGEIDIMNMEGPLAPKVLDGANLRPEMKAKGVKLSRQIDPEISYTYWNMQDPVVGGLTREKVALRRAMAMSYDVAEEIRVIRNGQAIEANFPIPPGVVGHDPAWKPGITHDPAGANALLDRFGYKRGADGWRTLPDGKPLVVKLSSRPDTLGRQQDELWKKSLDRVGIRMDVHKDKFPELIKAEKQCKLQMRVAAWIADYPDGDNFMQLLYGPNTFQSNNACAKIPEFDRLYEKSVAIPPGPERDALYREMTKVMEAYAPWRLMISRYRNMLVQPRVQGYRRHPILRAHWMYVDVAGPAAGR
ncbi:MAG: ABC transporter substrate-binding protein [Burkholderiales bacterium]|nr:ABC transporter substrate-binding protein [Burkholderiales bacterium]